MIDKPTLDVFLEKADKLCRGSAKTHFYEDCVLTLFFMKYVSDLYDAQAAAYRQKFPDDPETAAFEIKRMRWIVFDNSSFLWFYQNRDEENVVELIKAGLARYGGNVTNDATMFSTMLAVNLYNVSEQLSGEDTEMVRQILDLIAPLDLSGKEEFDVMGYVFDHFRHWPYASCSFASDLIFVF